MKWAGILYVNQSMIYYNCRLISSSSMHMYNQWCMNDKNRPKQLLIFEKKDQESKRLIKEIVKKLPSSQSIIHYEQYYPFIYGLVNKAGYLRSCLIAIWLSFALISISVQNEQKTYQAINYHLKHHTYMYKVAPKIIDQINQACESKNCVKRFQISASYIIIDLISTIDFRSLPKLNRINCNVKNQEKMIICKVRESLW